MKAKKVYRVIKGKAVYIGQRRDPRQAMEAAKKQLKLKWGSYSLAGPVAALAHATGEQR